MKKLTPQTLLLLGIVCLTANGQSPWDQIKGTWKPAQQPKPEGQLSGKYPVIHVSRPPDVQLRGRTLSIVPSSGAVFPNMQALQLTLEQNLQSEFTIEKGGKADSILTFTVISYDPVKTRTYTQTESRIVQIGQTSCKNLLGGGTTTCPQYGPRNVPIEYWEATGSLLVSTSVKDSSGTLIGAFSPDKTVSTYTIKKVVAENGESKLGGQALPDANALAQQLVDHVAQAITRAYSITNQVVEVPLSTEGPLKTGNNFAMAGHWKEAMAAWQAAKAKNEGDRAYNLAVANEALAYQAYDQSREPDTAAPYFSEAFKLYDQALMSKPGDSNFRKAQVRIQESKANFDRAKQQYEAQQRNASLEEAKIKAKQEEEEKKRRQADADAARPDSQDESEFRKIARQRLSSLRNNPDDAYQAKLIDFGRTTYQLDDNAAQRIVHQEIGRKEKLKVILEHYKETFADFVADGTLDGDERAQLAKIAQRSDLSADDVKPIESQFTYKDLTVHAAAPRPKPKAPGTKSASSQASPQTEAKPAIKQ